MKRRPKRILLREPPRGWCTAIGSFLVIAVGLAVLFFVGGHSTPLP